MRLERTPPFVKKFKKKKIPGESHRVQKVIREVRVFEMTIALELVVPTNVSIHNQISSSRFRE